MDETFDVVVVGGGLAGLTAAATAAGRSASVLLLDVRSDPGGRAVTDEVGCFRFNRGAHALYRTGAGRPVLDRLGVRVTGSPPPLKGALGRLGDEVGLLPQDVGSLLRTRLLDTRDKVLVARALAGVRRWRPEGLAGQSVDQWLDGFGARAVVRQMMEMLVRLTTYVVDTRWVSADLAATQVQAALGAGVDYVAGGWATLVDGLAAAAERAGVEVRAGQAAHAVVPEGRRTVVHADGGRVVAGRVVVAVGTPAATMALLPEVPPAWARLGPACRAACLDVGLDHVPATGVLLGIDRPLYLTRHAPPPTGLAPEGGAVMQALRYLGGDEDPPPAVARRELAEHCAVAGIDTEQAEEVRYLHRMVVCGATPTPGEGGMAGRPGVRTGIDGVLVAGDWVGPRGHLADAALASGELAGRVAAQELERAPFARAPA
jgi:phytoene dehydrogenase-like protein